jgi:hypothetical protein
MNYSHTALEWREEAVDWVILGITVVCVCGIGTLVYFLYSTVMAKS